MSFTLPQLPYPYDALEPIIDRETMQIHHTKHHQSYIDKLNAGLQSHPTYESWSVSDLLKKIKELPEDLQKVVRNHGGGHANHTLFRTLMRPTQENNKPSENSPLTQAIMKQFGSFESFTDAFATTASGQFGSGWAWLVKSGDSLEVISSANQDSPLMEGKTPLLGLDVWEHAYYLHYQNKRPAYVEARWSVVNWDKVEELYNS